MSDVGLRKQNSFRTGEAHCTHPPWHCMRNPVRTDTPGSVLHFRPPWAPVLCESAARSRATILGMRSRGKASGTGCRHRCRNEMQVGREVPVRSLSETDDRDPHIVRGAMNGRTHTGSSSSLARTHCPSHGPSFRTRMNVHNATSQLAQCARR